MKNNGYRDYLLHIRKQTKNEKNKLRIDFIIRTIDNIGLDKIDDITTENDKVTILFKHNFIEPEKIIYNRITNAVDYGFFILKSIISFQLFSPKIDITHRFSYKMPDSYLHIRGKKYQNTYRASKNKSKNIVLHKKYDSEIFDIKIPDYLNYTYDILQDIKKDLMNLKIPKEDLLHFVKYEHASHTGKINEIEYINSIDLIDDFFNKNDFLTNDNFYNFLKLYYSNDAPAPYISYFIYKIFDEFLSKLI